MVRFYCAGPVADPESQEKVLIENALLYEMKVVVQMNFGTDFAGKLFPSCSASSRWPSSAAAYQLPKNSSNKMWQQPGPYTAINGTISLQQPVFFHSKILGRELIPYHPKQHLKLHSLGRVPWALRNEHTDGTFEIFTL